MIKGSLKRKTMVVLIGITLTGCSGGSSDVRPMGEYGVEQNSQDGRYVLCNPCRMPTPKEADTAQSANFVPYGESVANAMTQSMTALARLALVATQDASAKVMGSSTKDTDAAPKVDATKSDSAMPPATEQAPGTPSPMATAPASADPKPATESASAKTSGSTAVPSGSPVAAKPRVLQSEPASDVFSMIDTKAAANTTNSLVKPDAQTDRTVTVNEPSSHKTEASRPSGAAPVGDLNSKIDPPKTSEVNMPATRAVTTKVSMSQAASIAPMTTDIGASADKIVVNFDNNSTDLDDGALNTLLALATAAPANARLVIVGFTDAIGSMVVNDRVAKARMQTVRNWFASHGIDGSRLSADPSDSKGLCCYVADNRTPAGRAANRRVEIAVVQEPDAQTTSLPLHVAATPAIANPIRKE